MRNRTETLCFSPYLYRARSLVERFFNKIKHCRCGATRYDKLAANYLAFVQLASLRLWLRINEVTSWSLAEAEQRQASGRRAPNRSDLRTIAGAPSRSFARLQCRSRREQMPA